MEKIAIALPPRRPDPLVNWRRDVLCRAVAYARGSFADDVAVEYFGKSAVTPTTSTSAAALSPTEVGAFLESLRPRSATARLFERALPVSLDGVAQVTLPRRAAFAQPTWVLEGDPIPAAQGSVQTATLGPLKKLAAITTLTGELARATRDQAQQIIKVVMEDAAAVALDASVFSTTAASTTRPAGILNGVTPITAVAGGGSVAMIGDLKSLAGAIATAGGGLGVMIFANPAQAIALAAQVGPGFGEIEIVPTPALSAGTIVAIEPDAIAYSIGPPKVDFSSGAVIHQETVPLQIATGTQGSGVLATPTQSLWQSDLVAMRIILRATWAARSPGFVQVINATTW